MITVHLITVADVNSGDSNRITFRDRGVASRLETESGPSTKTTGHGGDVAARGWGEYENRGTVASERPQEAPAQYLQEGGFIGETMRNTAQFEGSGRTFLCPGMAPARIDPLQS